MTTPADRRQPADRRPAGPCHREDEVTWRGERLFDAGPAGRTHRIDASAKEAPGPVETLLNAIATCSSVDVIDIIAKRKTPVERLAVTVAAERRPEFPRRVHEAADRVPDRRRRDRARARRARDPAVVRALLLRGRLARAGHHRRDEPDAERRERYPADAAEGVDASSQGVADVERRDGAAMPALDALSGHDRSRSARP